MANESFELRVKRLFGSTLFETVPKSAFPSASWSVADGAVERREWNRDRGDDPADREDIPCSSAFYNDGGCLQKRADRRRDLKKKEFEGDLDDDEEEISGGEEEIGGGSGSGGRGGSGSGGRGGSGSGGRGGSEQEEQDIRSSVGLDPTLDNEEEEDEFDRVAICKENAGERMYMRDVNDQGPYLSCRSVIPDLYEDSLEEVNLHRKDPRADHFAASVRLTEDNAARTFPDKGPSRASEVDVNLKPILKRKESTISSKPNKRVRFDPSCKDVIDETLEEPQDFHTVPQSMEATAAEDVASSSGVEPTAVPDYMRNPSKYTRYTFDISADDDKTTNKYAFEDFCNLVKKLKPEVKPDFPMELPKTVTFIPRKKACDAMPIDDKSEFTEEASCKESGQVLNCSAVIAAEEVPDNEVCEMEEDDVQTPMVEEAGSSSKKERRYRSKTKTADDSA